MTGKLITLQLRHEIFGGLIFGANFVDVAKIRESIKITLNTKPQKFAVLH